MFHQYDGVLKANTKMKMHVILIVICDKTVKDMYYFPFISHNTALISDEMH